MQGPEQYLNELGVELACAVNPDRPAVLDAAHRVFVNYETYFVSDDAARERFEGEVYAFCGPVTDPVTRERFQPDASSQRREHGGRIFLFASDDTAAEFDSDPERYGTLMLSMAPVKE